MKNDYELVRWPPDVEKDKAAGIHVAGEEQDDETPDAAQVYTEPIVALFLVLLLTGLVYLTEGDFRI